MTEHLRGKVQTGSLWIMQTCESGFTLCVCVCSSWLEGSWGSWCCSTSWTPSPGLPRGCCQTRLWISKPSWSQLSNEKLGQDKAVPVRIIDISREPCVNDLLQCYRYSVTSNLVLEVDDIIPELKLFKEAGGGCVCDLTSIGIRYSGL